MENMSEDMANLMPAQMLELVSEYIPEHMTKTHVRTHVKKRHVRHNTFEYIYICIGVRTPAQRNKNTWTHMSEQVSEHI